MSQWRMPSPPALARQREREPGSRPVFLPLPLAGEGRGEGRCR